MKFDDWKYGLNRLKSPFHQDLPILTKSNLIF